MKSQNRPLSPHIQIYAMHRFTSLTSLMHRATGIVCSLGMIFVVTWLALSAYSEATYLWANQILSHWFVIGGMFVWSGCLCYHFCNGIRHMAWDIGYGLNIPSAWKGAKMVMAGTVIMNISFWVAIWSVL